MNFIFYSEFRKQFKKIVYKCLGNRISAASFSEQTRVVSVAPLVTQMHNDKKLISKKPLDAEPGKKTRSLFHISY